MARVVVPRPAPRPPAPPRPVARPGRLDLGIPLELDGIGRASLAPEVTSIGLVELAPDRRRSLAPAVAYSPSLGGTARTGIVVPVRTNPRRPPEQPKMPELRVLAQNVVTRRWQHLDVPIDGLSIVKTLSGAQGLTGKLGPALPDLVAADFRPDATRFIVEDEDGQVRGSTILQAPFAIDDDERAVEAAGVSSVAARETYDSEYSTTGVDPLDVVRMLWTHILTKPGRGPLKVTIGTATSKVRIPAPAADSGFAAQQSGQATNTASTETPTYSVNWWEGTKIGAEIDELAKQTPFDYVERARWNDDRTDVLDHVELAWPRLGRRRTDLRFAEGENIIDKLVLRRSQRVTGVRVRGAGEGRAMILGSADDPPGDGLPVVIDIQDSTVTSTERATSRARGELRRKRIPLSIEKILVDARHPHAPYGSYDEGDDILVQVDVDWVGVVALWHRITGWTWTPDEEAVAIDLVPSDAFRYGTED